MISELKELGNEIKEEVRDVQSYRYWRENPGTHDDYFFGSTLSGGSEPDAAGGRAQQIMGTVGHAIESALQTTVDHAAACVHVCNKRGLFSLRLRGGNKTHGMQ